MKLMLAPCTVTGFSFGAFALAQAAAPTENATLQALLDEVRRLRVAMEKSMLRMPKIHLALQGTQLQEQQVARSQQRLDAVLRKNEQRLRKPAPPSVRRSKQP